MEHVYTTLGPILQRKRLSEISRDFPVAMIRQPTFIREFVFKKKIRGESSTVDPKRKMLESLGEGGKIRVGKYVFQGSQKPNKPVPN